MKNGFLEMGGWSRQIRFLLSLALLNCAAPGVPSQREMDLMVVLGYILAVDAAPSLGPLHLSQTTTTSIVLRQPEVVNGAPATSLRSYIGLRSSLSVAGSVVTGALEGPVNVTSGGYSFNGLSPNTDYEIVVVAVNQAGVDVERIVQNTGNLSPVLNPLSVSSFDAVAIALASPALSTIGNPTPTVLAFLGVDGVISITGDRVSGSLQGPIDVSSSGTTFTGLTPLTAYRIIVVANNASGFSVQQILQATTGIAPVLNPLSIASVWTSSISVTSPTFLTEGLPQVGWQAYIGIDGTISVSGATVSNSVQGPLSNGTSFFGLNSGVAYRVVVVAQNSAGYSVQQIVQTTSSNAPVLQGLSLATGPTSINLMTPTFLVAGNPAPTVRGYLGLDGTISVSGNTITGALVGPVDVSTSNYNFTGLTTGTSYRVIVVAENLAGYSVQQFAITPF